jgi:hypothetical protein
MNIFMYLKTLKHLLKKLLILFTKKWWKLTMWNKGNIFYIRDDIDKISNIKLIEIFNRISYIE